MPEAATKEDLRKLKAELKTEMRTEWKEDLHHLGESLLTFMQASFARIDQRFDEMGARFDAQPASLDRHAACFRPAAAGPLG